MNLRVDASQLRDLSSGVGQQIRGAHDHLWRVVRSVSLAAERRIKSEMPVDTGRARASWGHWTPGDLALSADANAGDAVWDENERSLKIKQGSNVEYVVYLNDGHSMQAPAGFIDMAAERAQDVLDAEVDAVLRAWGFN